MDYGQVIKLYGPTPAGPGRYSPAECTGIKKRAVEGYPDDRHVSHFTRLTNGHSKKVANHAHMVALYTLFYNFIRTHSKFKMTPAMHVPAKVRGPYKKRATA